MKSRSGNDASQANFHMPDLSSMLDQRQALCRLARAIDWQGFEGSFGTFYEEGKGSLGKPIRLMAGLLILKQLHDLSDESVVEQWTQNPYFQHFTGELHFRWELPVDPSSLSRFRKRIGAQGCERVLKESIRLHGAKTTEATVIADTTVQEKNVTYPTDSKLARKISEKCAKIAEHHGVKLRRSYRRSMPKLMRAGHNRSNPKRAKNARKAERKLFRKRAGIEPVIGHLKSDFRFGRNYLKGLVGDEINLLMAAAAFNFKKWMKDPSFLLRLLGLFSSKREILGLPAAA